MVKDINLQPLLDTRQNQLGLVFSDSDGIDTKALAILGTNVAILIFIAQAALHFAVWWHHALFLTPFILSLLVNAAAIWPRSYIGAGVSVDEHPEYLDMDELTLVLQLLADTELAIRTNQGLNRQRWRLCLFAMGLLAFASLWLFAIL